MITDKIKSMINQMELKEAGTNGYVPKIENIILEFSKLVDDELNKKVDK